MKSEFVFLSPITVYDDKVFTEERAKEWKKHMKECYSSIYEGLYEKIDNSTKVNFFASKFLIDEVVIDAIIGMKKITESKFNSIENPNSFKVIAYLTYWWLRHKPISIHYEKSFNLNNIRLSPKYIVDGDDEKNEYQRQKLIWELKHVNELVAVNMALTYIFNFNKEICDKKRCKKISNDKNNNYHFESFEKMRNTIVKKLLYYFSYRAIAPKVIEHFLEGYTFHPAWALTGDHWKESNKEGIV